MIVFRLAKAAFTALDGEGARLYGGRWNSVGRPMIYSSAGPSLAVLEIIVHLDLPLELIPDDYRLLTIAIPDDAPVERLEILPTDPTPCAALGDGFLDRNQALTLSVPSVVVPQDRNVLINVRHPAMAAVQIVGDEPFGFDPRLFGAAD
ncbi:MAG TPA: RES family NAD+ phosphorylase [Caulobacteraceae bacterium]